MNADDRVEFAIEAVRARGGQATFVRLREDTGFSDAELRIALQEAKRDGRLLWRQPFYVLPQEAPAPAEDVDLPTLADHLAGQEMTTCAISQTDYPCLTATQPPPADDPDVTALRDITERFRQRLADQQVAQLADKTRLLRKLSAFFRDDYAALLADAALDLERLSGASPWGPQTERGEG